MGRCLELLVGYSDINGLSLRVLYTLYIVIDAVNINGGFAPYLFGGYMWIPNDKGSPWRLNKFVEYQHLAPAVDPLTYVEFAKRRKLDHDDCVLLAWFHSLTYSEITAGLLLLNTNEILIDPERFWAIHKDNLIFGSARKYVKNMDWFVPLINKFVDQVSWSSGEPKPYDWLRDIKGIVQPQEAFKNIEKELLRWKYMGRFSVDLFMEAIVSMSQANLFGFNIKSPLEYDWKKTSNLTSGLLNIMYLDEEANEFDRTGKLTTPVSVLDSMLEEIVLDVRLKYPDQKVDTMSVVNKICSFRNLFKKSRYGGFHHDRQLGNLRHYEQVYPEYEELWEEFYDIRVNLFPRHMLGEYGGWDGIRPARKKLWVTKGLTGVEQ